MICFAINNRDSFDNVSRWKQEIQEVEPEKPIILAMTKIDLADMTEDPVTLKELKDKSWAESFKGFVSTSAKV